MAEILQNMIDADVLVLASPVYFYSIDAQLKALIDCTVARSADSISTLAEIRTDTPLFI